MATLRFIVKSVHGGYLHRFDIGWFNHHQDDPSCWTDNAETAHGYTLEQIERMRTFLEGFQGAFTIEPATVKFNSKGNHFPRAKKESTCTQSESN
jgi:hypothetical protein